MEAGILNYTREFIALEVLWEIYGVVQWFVADYFEQSSWKIYQPTHSHGCWRDKGAIS